MGTLFWELSPRVDHCQIGTGGHRSTVSYGLFVSERSLLGRGTCGWFSCSRYETDPIGLDVMMSKTRHTRKRVPTPSRRAATSRERLIRLYPCVRSQRFVWLGVFRNKLKHTPPAVSSLRFRSVSQKGKPSVSFLLCRRAEEYVVSVRIARHRYGEADVTARHLAFPFILYRRTRQRNV